MFMLILFSLNTRLLLLTINDPTFVEIRELEEKRQLEKERFEAAEEARKRRDEEKKRKEQEDAERQKVRICFTSKHHLFLRLCHYSSAILF